MATIALISIHDAEAFGLRALCAGLERDGHTCHLLFLKRFTRRRSTLAERGAGETPWYSVGRGGELYECATGTDITARELALLTELLAEIKPGVVGFSVTTPLRSRAARVTRALRRSLNVPILWGGADPTINLSDCVDLCDYCCVGEGEQTILDVAQCSDAGLSLDDVNNLAYRRGEEIVQNPRHPLVTDLNRLPWLDFRPERKYLVDEDRLVRRFSPLAEAREDARTYRILTARGCPYHCEYCCESALKELYASERFMRRRSPEDVIAELEAARRDHGFRLVSFGDDVFSVDVKWLKAFLPLYRERVALPFTANLFPARQSVEVVSLLADAGLTHACVALQSGSERIQHEVFGRVYEREWFLRAVEACRVHGITVYTDVITYNPYENEDDLQETLAVLLAMAPGYRLTIYRLFVPPGTALAARMRADGIDPERPVSSPLFDFYVRLFWIASFRKRREITVALARALPLLKQTPWLLNPKAIEWLVSPRSALEGVYRRGLFRPKPYEW